MSLFKFTAVFALVLVLTVPAFAQGDRDHDDDGPIQVGYAIVTPLATTASGLVVFETFGSRHGGRGPGSETLQAGILPSPLTTDAVLFVNTHGRLSRNLGVALANPSSTSAIVTLTLRNHLGTQVAQKVVTVAARQQTAQFVTQLFADRQDIPRDFTGSLRITSPTPIAAIGLRFRGENFSTIPVTSLSTPASVPQVSSGVGGPGAIMLAHFAAGGGWATEIVIMNPATTDVTVRLDLFKPDGTPLVTTLNGQSASSFTNLTVPAGGVLILAPREDDGESRF